MSDTINQIEPMNLTALLRYRGRGNPPGVHPASAISNCFPGLEFDLRAIWKRLFTGLELHESDNRVFAIEPGGDAEAQGIVVGMRLLSVGSHSVETIVSGPRTVGGPKTELILSNLEWTNALAPVVTEHFPPGSAPGATASVACVFVAPDDTEVPVTLQIRNLFDGVAIAQEAAIPGRLTEGLCSPWQSDYRECGCYYWAASRPDFVNVVIDPATGEASGRNWLDKTRDRTQYRLDSTIDPELVTYEELYQAWETMLPIQLDGKDEIL